MSMVAKINLPILVWPLFIYSIQIQGYVESRDSCSVGLDNKPARFSSTRLGSVWLVKTTS
jgi:hypothetical protein